MHIASHYKQWITLLEHLLLFKIHSEGSWLSLRPHNREVGMRGALRDWALQSAWTLHCVPSCKSRRRLGSWWSTALFQASTECTWASWALSRGSFSYGTGTNRHDLSWAPNRVLGLHLGTQNAYLFTQDSHLKKQGHWDPPRTCVTLAATMNGVAHRIAKTGKYIHDSVPLGAPSCHPPLFCLVSPSIGLN